MKNPTDVSMLQIEKLLAGELEPGAAERLEARIRTFPQGEEFLAHLRAENQEILRAYPARTVAAAALQRVYQARTRRLRNLGLILAPLAAGLALALYLFPGDPATDQARKPVPLAVNTPASGGIDQAGPDGDAGLEQTTPKGDPAVLVFRKTPEGQEPMANWDEARPGDVLQLKFLVGDADHAVLLSVDGNHNITLHHPLNMQGETEVAPGSTVTLPRAYELDDAPEFELFILVTADLPLVPGDLMRAASEQSIDEEVGLDLDPDLKQTLFLVRKTN